MTSSRTTTAFVVLLSVLPLQVAGQAGSEGARAEAIAAYNTATRIEREGYADPAAGPGSELRRRYLEDCISAALRSHRAMPSLLASWRLASCASAVQRPVLAWMAFRAFESLGENRVTTWTHGSIDESERARVLEAHSRVGELIGAVRLPDLLGQRIEWHGPGPTRLEPDGLPRSSATIIIDDDGVIYGPVGRSLVGRLAPVAGDPVMFEIRFTPLSGGVQDMPRPRR